MTDKVLLCAIAKQENLYIKEWVDYHLNLGFDHITIYDNNNTNGERISDVVSGDMRVDVVDFRGKTQKSCETQVEAYNHCYRNAKNYTWVLFIDIDEFLWFKDYTNIKVFLSQNWVRRANVIRFHWKCYSDGEQLRYEDRPVMERFTQPCENAEVNFHTKQMYRTDLGSLRIVNVHYSTNVSYIFYPDGRPAPYTTSTKDSSVHDEVAHIKHYVTKSLEEYVGVKWARRCDGSSKTRLSMDFYFKYNKRTDEKVRYYNQLMNELKENKGNVFVPKHTSGRNACPAELAVCPGAVKSSPKTSAATPKISPNSADVAKVDKEYPFGVSVCISAWKTAEYIEECLDSVAAQTWFKDHDNYEILLGIDGCEETLAKVKDIMGKYKNLRVMMMDKNVGTYVTCNTIMKEAKYEWLLRFDSDDVMYPNMVEVLMEETKDKTIDMITPKCSDGEKDMIWAEGQIFVKNKMFAKYGGFSSFRCGCDTEFRVRTRTYIKQTSIQKTLFFRRPHKNSLTKSNSTKMGSDYREQVKKYIKETSPSKPIINGERCSFKCINFNRIIVSFTTWSKRQESAAKMLEHFKKQTRKPDKIYCWLSSDEYGDEKVPQCLKKYVDENFVEIKWIKNNIYCYKRYEVFKECQNDYVFLIDDDIYYETDYLEKMYNAAHSHKNNIICFCGNCVEITKERKLTQLKDNPSIKNTILSGLSCYPPNVFPMEYFELTNIRDEMSPKCDDSFLRVLAIKNNIKTFCIYDRTQKSFKTIPNTQDVGIWNTQNKNTIDGINIQTIIFKKLVHAFNIEEKCKLIWKQIVL